MRRPGLAERGERGLWQHSALNQETAAASVALRAGACTGAHDRLSYGCHTTGCSSAGIVVQSDILWRPSTWYLHASCSFITGTHMAICP